MKMLMYFLVLAAGFVTHAAINKESNGDCSARPSGPLWQSSQNSNVETKKPAPSTNEGTQHAGVKSVTQGS